MSAWDAETDLLHDAAQRVSGRGEIHVWLSPATRDEALLRRLLARYVGAPPTSIALAIGAHGKPYVEHDALRFNLSHSAEHTAVALAHGCEIGVDIEHVRRIRRRAALLERCFTPAEQDRIGGDDLRLLRFWSAKEALVKAIGRGIAYGLRRIEVDWSEQGPRVLRLDGEAGPASRWRLAALPELDGGLGVVAYEGEVRPIRCSRLRIGAAD
jgi:4'-phosphopantetheinyl transferase